MEFEWDEEKDEANYRKHGIRFTEARTAFLDPKGLEFFDSANSLFEDLYLLIGTSANLKVLLVVFCYRELNVLRIISARKATPRERSLYEEGI